MNDSVPQIARWAKRYCELGFKITWTPPGQKGPRHLGWQRPENAVSDPRAALDHWTHNPQHGIAALLAPSKLVSLDIDDEAASVNVLGHLGIDLKRLRDASPCIVARHFRLMFRAPDEPLQHRTVAWPKRKNSTQRDVIFELRAGCVSDTLPPTIHPKTGVAYRWEMPPAGMFFPMPPEALLRLWRDWPGTAHRALALCPWAPTPPRSSFDPPPVDRSKRPVSANHPRESVIAAFNAAHDAANILEAHGYKRIGKKRFASPGTQHAAGIVLKDDGKIFCHHAGDALASEHALDAFDCYRVLEHHGNLKAAVKAAAEALGINRSAT